MRGMMWAVIAWKERWNGGVILRRGVRMRGGDDLAATRAGAGDASHGLRDGKGGAAGGARYHSAS